MQIGKQRKPEAPMSRYFSPCLQVDIYYFLAL